MSRSVLLVFTNATDGNDEEFNRWYDEVHLKEVLQVPGFVAAERFDLGDTHLTKEERKQRYLAIYEIEGDPAAAIEALQKAVPEMNMSDTLHSKMSTSLFTQLSPRQTQPDR